MTDSPHPTQARRWPIAAAVAAVTTVVVVASANGGELRGEFCGRHDASTAILGFVVESGAALHERLPHLGISPELDAADGTLSVFVFEASTNALPLFPPLQQGDNAVAPAVPDRVVCVLTADGVENYYVGVDLSGLDPDGVVTERQDH